MRRSLLVKILAVVLGIPVLLVLAGLLILALPRHERKPTGKVPIEFRILANRKHDNDDIEQALKSDDLARAPGGYRWVKLDPKCDIQPGDNAIIRVDPKSAASYILVRLDSHNVTEKDFDSVYPTQDEHLQPAIGFYLDRNGARRFGALTREHLPEDDGAFKYQMAIILNDAVLTAPSINTEIRDSGIIEGGGKGFSTAEVERLITLMTQLHALDIPAPQLGFRDAKLGLFMHWGVSSLLGKGTEVMDADKLPVSEYEKLPPRFNPADFDAEAWVKLAKSAGMKYITITAKDHDGFCMFDSKLTRYDIVDATPFGKDPLKALADACHKQEIPLFFAYSLLDWHHPDYYPRGQTGKHSGRENKGDWSKYVAYYQGQVRELCTNYGEIGGIAFDGSWDRPDASWDFDATSKLIHDLQPRALIGNNNRARPFPGEDFRTVKLDRPGVDQAGDDLTLSVEVCVPINRSWGYNAFDKDYKTPEQLLHALLSASGRGANLLLEVGPKPDGSIAPEAAERLMMLGKWLDKYGQTVYDSRRGPIAPQPWGVSTAKLDQLGQPEIIYLHVLKSGVPVKLPDRFRSFDARLFGATDLLPVSQEKGALRIDLAEKDRTPMDTIVVLTPKLLPR